MSPTAGWHAQKKSNKDKITKKIVKKPKQKIKNKIIHSLNGNQVLKMVSWNKGNAKFCNRIDQIQEILDRYKPKFLAIQELNWTSDQDPIELKFQGFNMEMDQLINTRGRSRSAILIHEDLRYTRRLDLETGDESHIWITVNLQR